MIPDAAVEAAWAAMMKNAGLRSLWSNASPEWWERYRASMRAALEAAAPHMLAVCDGGYTCPSAAHIEGCFRPHVENELLAKAWDGGRTHGARYPYGERGLATDDNPYRSQA